MWSVKSNLYTLTIDWTIATIATKLEGSNNLDTSSFEFSKPTIFNTLLKWTAWWVDTWPNTSKLSDRLYWIVVSRLYPLEGRYIPPNRTPAQSISFVDSLLTITKENVNYQQIFTAVLYITENFSWYAKKYTLVYCF